MHFRGGQTLKIILVSPKDKDTIANRNSVIVEVDFLWNRTVDSLKTSFHPLLLTSSGLKE